MAVFSPPRLFAAWRVEAPFSAASLFAGCLYVVLSLTRRVIVHDAASFSRGSILYMNVSAHAMHCLASSFLPCGSSKASPYWYRRFNQRTRREVLTAHLLVRTHAQIFLVHNSCVTDVWLKG